MRSARSNTASSGAPQGTLGGAAPHATTSRPRMPQFLFGEEVYLWILIFLEVAAMGWLRKHFRRHHGG